MLSLRYLQLNIGASIFLQFIVCFYILHSIATFWGETGNKNLNPTIRKCWQKMLSIGMCLLQLCLLTSKFIWGKA